MNPKVSSSFKIYILAQNLVGEAFRLPRDGKPAPYKLEFSGLNSIKQTRWCDQFGRTTGLLQINTLRRPIYK